MVSTWPSVWSLASPSPSHRTASTPSDSPKHALDPLRVDGPVAVRVQHALARRQDAPLAVHVDGATLEDERRLDELANPGQGRDTLRDVAVVFEHVLAAPAVEDEAYGRLGAAGADEEDGRRVAQPDVAERHAVETYARRRQRSPGELLLGVVGDQHFRSLALGDRRYEASEGRARRGQVVLPEIGVARPCNPRGRVARPFGGCVETMVARGGQGDGMIRSRRRFAIVR